MRYLKCAALLLALALSPLARAANDTNDLQGKPAPDFALKTLDGKDAKLSDEKGNVVVVDFWATWCPPCRKSLPHLNKIASDKSLAEKGLKVMAVDAQEKADVVQNFVSENKFTFNVPMDADGATMKDYKVQGIPTTVVVGRDGMIKNVFIGFVGEKSVKALDAAIESALKEPKPAK